MKLFCPITGLQVSTQDDWCGRRLRDHFTANFYIVGQSILYSGPSGTADLQNSREVLQLSGEVAQKVAGGTGFYLQIEDYTAFNKATIEARKYFIDQMITRDRLLALIFCNLSPMLQLFAKVGQRFNTTKKGVYIVRDYMEAITLALKLCNEHKLETGPFVFGNQTTYRDDIPTMIPSEILSNNSWNVETDSFTNRSHVIDRSILFAVSSGFFQENHMPLIDDAFSSVREDLLSHENLDYFVVDVSALKGGSRKARQLYMKFLKDLYERYPFHLYIIYGVNAFMRTAARLAIPFMPFKVMIARDISHAFELVIEDKRPKNKKKPTIISDPIQEYQEELLAYIGSIDWEQEGFSDIYYSDDQSHPFYEIFQAIKLIKNEMDDLFRTRQQVQDRLVKSENKYRELFEKGSDLLYTHDFEGILIDTNFAFKRGYGWDSEWPPGKNVRDLISERYRHRFDNYLDRIKSKGHDEGTMIVTTAVGREVVLEYNNVLVKDDGGKPIFIQGSARDITDRVLAERESKKLQEQLAQKHKLEAIGTLAGGIAHDFNNILAIIIGNTELAIMDIPELNPAKEYLKEILTASLRAKEVVRHILSFSRKAIIDRKPIKIGSIITDSLKMLRASIPADIEIRRSISCQSDIIMADPTQISQVLMNLCTNAAHAMHDEGGILEVSLQNIDFGIQNMAYDLGPGRYLKLSVSDTGHGIDPEKIDRIFDPYFTTKGLGEGTGLGLSMVKGIVQAHGGAVTVKSEPGKGAVFKVLFPVIEGEMELEIEGRNVFPTGNEKILFIDDEESILGLVKKRLEIQGYQIEVNNSPVDALEIFRFDPDRFDLIITDMTMPKMTGDKFAKEILCIRPDMPIILCSGYSDRINAEKAKALGIRKYIEKPLDMSDFLTSIRYVLDENNSSIPKQLSRSKKKS